MKVKKGSLARLTSATDLGVEQHSAAKQRYSLYKALVDRTLEVFEDKRNATIWLSTPLPELSGLSPMDFAKKSDYRNLGPIELILGQMEHGVYS